MRLATPPNSKITGDAKEAVDECLAKFITIVNRAAAAEYKRDKRTNVTGDDLLLAMGNLGFDDYVGPLIPAPLPRERGHATHPSQHDVTGAGAGPCGPDIAAGPAVGA
ncbi:hypothetical protein BAE44_0008607 [Dichanthelium oligosanthes]|uniref:Transcription factor CBF/NF-Y/archaeal histone domain-containing protein n=1 Tax=Dichanthelium oligosanthes TaxID=888268 RepID=A0A1E5VZ68_9POAL|nr:hypothetical protein BAE44_0008607 [Dichanthelium oligosanthes]